MTVSVVVPLYNKEPYVLRALESIAAQTFPEFEVIVVDDGSTDRGAEVAESFRDARFRVIRQKNAGPAGARNRGVAEARGDLIAFLDGDDCWRPEYLSRATGVLSERPTVSAFTACHGELPDRNLEEIWRKNGIRDGLQQIDAITPLLLHYMVAFMSPCSTVARTEVVRRYGGFREGSKYGEDAILWLRVLLNEQVWFDLETLVDFDRAGSGLSGNLKGPRPVEPFVENPALILDYCPRERRELVQKFLALRAAKTAAMLGYWGRTNEATTVFGRFLKWHDRGLWQTWAGYAGTTHAGAMAGWLYRLVLGR